MDKSIKRNILITLVMITISVVLCTLGFNTASKPIDSIAVIWPGAILQSVGTILFGGWGVVATVISGIIANWINVGTFHVSFGYSLPNFLQDSTRWPPALNKPQSRNNSELRAESVLGKGTTFYIQLPCQTQSPAT